MRIAVTSFVSTGHLMTFPGRITDQLLAEAGGTGPRQTASVGAGVRHAFPIGPQHQTVGRMLGSGRTVPVGARRTVSRVIAPGLSASRGAIVRVVMAGFP